MPLHYLPHILHWAYRSGGALAVVGAIIGGLLKFDDSHVMVATCEGCAPTEVDRDALVHALEGAVVGVAIGAVAGIAVALFLVFVIGLRKSSVIPEE